MLQELYQEVVMDHNSRPRNFGSLGDANRSADGFNPFCGDKIRVYLKVTEERVCDISFDGSGCAISRASASMLTQAVKGQTVDGVMELFETFHHMVTREPGEAYDTESLGDAEVLSGIVEFPIRVKCASLPWHTLRSALLRSEETVTTE